MCEVEDLNSEVIFTRSCAHVRVSAVIDNVRYLCCMGGSPESCHPSGYQRSRASHDQASFMITQQGGKKTYQSYYSLRAKSCVKAISYSHLNVHQLNTITSCISSLIKNPDIIFSFSLPSSHTS